MEERHRQSVIPKVIGVTVAFFLALVGLICWKTQSLPTEIDWLDGAGLDAVTAAVLYESRIEVAALGFAALNFLWLLIAMGQRRSKESSATDSSLAMSLSAQINDAQDENDSVELSSAPSEPTIEVNVDAAGEPGVVHKLITEEQTQSVAVDADASCKETTRSPCHQSEAQAGVAMAQLNRVKRELVSVRQQLETARQVKSQFLANVSHELRTPMNGIMGMTDLLLNGDLPERERRFASSIAVSSSSLLAIISDLLDFTRIESGTLLLEHSRFRVRDCVEDVCALLADAAHVKDVELVCYVDSNVPTFVEGDASRLRQILNNLIGNAIAFTENGEVVVRVACISDEGSGVVLQCDVQDTGVGIPPETQITLFEAFTQADESNTRRHGGLGMGLAITCELVSMMKGEITFRSRLGEGTRFTFSVSMDRVLDQSDDVADVVSIRGSRVLVVDDNETNRTILYHQLSSWGVIVDTVASGNAALSLLREVEGTIREHDIIILDLHMPDMDGVQLARAIQSDSNISDKRSLMLTSAVLEIGSEELAMLGVGKHISKPARQSVLHDSLASLLPQAFSRGKGSTELSVVRPSLPASIGAKVLLAEDDRVNQEVTMLMLESFACQATLAVNGAQAVELSSLHDYDLILMDCQMPILDGFEATRIIKGEGARNAGTPVIALTANAMAGDRERCLEGGMDDYLSKPVGQAALHTILRKWVHVKDGMSIATSAQELPEEFVKPAADKPTETPTKSEKTENIVPLIAVVNDVPAPDKSDYALDHDIGVDGPVSGAASPTINMKAIEMIRSLQRPGKEDLLTKVVNVYLDRTPEVLAEMQVAADNSDIETMKAHAHSLKSSSAYLGADGLSTICKRIESAAANDDLAALVALVAALPGEYDPVSSELAGMMVPKAA